VISRSALVFSPGAAGPLLGDDTALDWQRHAACQYTDPDLHFPESCDIAAVVQEAQARRVCAGCPVRLQCAEDALTAGIEHGIWGGTSPLDRSTGLASGKGAAEIIADADARYLAAQDKPLTPAMRLIRARVLTALEAAV